MIEFYASGKEYLLSNGKKIIIKRAGMGYLYRLICFYLEIDLYNNELKNVMRRRVENMHDEIKRILSKKNVLEQSVTVNVEPFLNVKWKKIHKDDQFGVIKAIIDFNSYGKNTGNNEDAPRLEEMIKHHNFVVLFLLEHGYNIKQATEEVDNYKACALIEAWKEKRVTEMTDIRMATQANNEDYKIYVHALQGHEIMTPEDVLKGGY